MRSEALPCLKEDKTASEERLGRAKAKPPHTPFPEATLSRGSPDCRMLINPAACPRGILAACAGNPRKTGVL
jgi:hypothetical protein